MRLALLGDFELSGRNGAIDLTSKKLVGLVAFLACTTPPPQAREKLMGLLWGSHSESNARQSLRQALTRLRRVLGPNVLVSRGESLSLDPNVIESDVVRFERLVLNGSRDALAKAVELYRGKFLADIAISEEAWTEWLDFQRERLGGMALEAMIKLGECELRSGDGESALRAAQRATNVDDLREDAHRLVIRALAGSGRRVEALKHYDRLSALLWRELNVRPDLLTRELVQEIRGETSPEQTPTPTAANVVAHDSVPAPLPLTAGDGVEHERKNTSRTLQFLRMALESGTVALPLTFGKRRRFAIAAASVFSLLIGASLTWDQLRSIRTETAAPERVASPLTEKPSIAVLPFANLSSDGGRDLMSEGLAQSLVNALARSPSIFLIAHSSTSVYAGGRVSAKQAARELSVRYIVEGSVKRAGDRVRVTTQLVDTLTNSVLWSDRYDRMADDLLTIEEEITTQIARTLDVRITYGSEPPAGGTRRLDAWTAYVQGRSEYLKFSRAGNLRAREHYERAVTLDPNYAEAVVAIAHTHLLELMVLPKEQWESALTRIEKLGHQAAQIDPRMPRLLQLRSMLALVRGDFDVALVEAEAMIERDPNGAESLMALGRIYFFSGQYERAIEVLGGAERIDPHSRASYAFHRALSHMALGRHDAAVSILKGVSERWPDYAPARTFLVIAYQLAGRDDDARQQLGRVPRNDPASTMRAIEHVFSTMRDQTTANRMIEAARQAGFPD